MGKLKEELLSVECEKMCQDIPLLDYIYIIPTSKGVNNMIKFEKWYDGLQTKIKACSSEETKENNNVECYYSVGNYLKNEIEYMQQTIDKQKEVLDKIKEIMKDYGDKEDISGYTMYYISGENIIHILELLEEIE